MSVRRSRPFDCVLATSGSKSLARRGSDSSHAARANRAVIAACSMAALSPAATFPRAISRAAAAAAASLSKRIPVSCSWCARGALLSRRFRFIVPTALAGIGLVDVGRWHHRSRFLWHGLREPHHSLPQPPSWQCRPSVASVACSQEMPGRSRAFRLCLASENSRCGISRHPRNTSDLVDDPTRSSFECAPTKLPKVRVVADDVIDGLNGLLDDRYAIHCALALILLLDQSPPMVLPLLGGLARSIDAHFALHGTSFPVLSPAR
ncbi:hypothetical protein FB554_2393 [Barrientosiimonas humi]|uniref:Uncharacterized protein n=1 Tax=Barrientosiimonas humi TaxID=999931 RepID=A0A542XEI2_9MICO|nr:hypothetical protein FB554_2393 [Barrientosiimonas humi]CAG7574222.1 hypothetical protein BH39T_PBIAJDOK_02865 [Barrientosiimonas humi]